MDLERKATHRLTFGLVLALTILVFGAPGVEAAFPGGNGQIAFTGDNPNGGKAIYQSGSGLLTLPPAAVFDSAPAYSLDGSKIAFIRRVGDFSGDFYLVVMPVDGSNFQVLVSTPSQFPESQLSSPSWGGNDRISFAVLAPTVSGLSGIWTVGGPEGLVITGSSL